MTMLASAPLVGAHLDTTAAHEGSRTTTTISVVIPVRNEARNIGWVLERMPSFVDEVIIVDSESTDDTLNVARSVMPHVVVVHQVVRGKGAALRAGFHAASGDLIVMMDADGSMDPVEISRFVAPLECGYDVVKGSRAMAAGGSEDFTWLRKAGNRFLLDVANQLYGLSMTELCYGFMAFRRTALRSLPLSSTGFEIETEIVVKAALQNLRMLEVGSRELARRHGTSYLRPFRDGFRALWALTEPRFTVGNHAATRQRLDIIRNP